jgi:hypothetical protein
MSFIFNRFSDYSQVQAIIYEFLAVYEFIKEPADYVKQMSIGTK